MHALVVVNLVVVTLALLRKKQKSWLLRANLYYGINE